MAHQANISQEVTPGGASNGSGEPAAHPLMFWLLIALAACAFVPAVLSPAWQDRIAWKEKEAALADSVAALQSRHGRNQAVIDALLSDPGAAERLAVRELGSTRAGERLVRLSNERHPALPSYARPAELSPINASPPQPLDRAGGSADRWSRFLSNPVFVSSPTRELLLGMAGVLTVAAFWLYRRP